MQKGNTDTHTHTEVTNVSMQEYRIVLLVRWLHRARVEVPNGPEAKQTCNSDTGMSKANASS